ncbi:MAG: hypothetical protein QXP42_02855 [Candidatus Micrarchaeia archaeon]
MSSQHCQQKSRNEPNKRTRLYRMMQNVSSTLRYWSLGKSQRKRIESVLKEYGLEPSRENIQVLAELDRRVINERLCHQLYHGDCGIMSNPCKDVRDINTLVEVASATFELVSLIEKHSYTIGINIDNICSTALKIAAGRSAEERTRIKIALERFFNDDSCVQASVLFEIMRPGIGNAREFETALECCAENAGRALKNGGKLPQWIVPEAYQNLELGDFAERQEFVKVCCEAVRFAPFQGHGLYNFFSAATSIAQLKGESIVNAGNMLLSLMRLHNDDITREGIAYMAANAPYLLDKTPEAVGVIAEYIGQRISHKSSMLGSSVLSDDEFRKLNNMAEKYASDPNMLKASLILSQRLKKFYSVMPLDAASYNLGLEHQPVTFQHIAQRGNISPAHLAEMICNAIEKVESKTDYVSYGIGHFESLFTDEKTTEELLSLTCSICQRMGQHGINSMKDILSGPSGEIFFPPKINLRASWLENFAGISLTPSEVLGYLRCVKHALDAAIDARPLVNLLFSTHWGSYLPYRDVNGQVRIALDSCALPFVMSPEDLDWVVQTVEQTSQLVLLNPFDYFFDNAAPLREVHQELSKITSMLYTFTHLHVKDGEVIIARVAPTSEYVRIGECDQISRIADEIGKHRMTIRQREWFEKMRKDIDEHRRRILDIARHTLDSEECKQAISNEIDELLITMNGLCILVKEIRAPALKESFKKYAELLGKLQKTAIACGISEDHLRAAMAEIRYSNIWGDERANLEYLVAATNSVIHMASHLQKLGVEPKDAIGLSLKFIEASIPQALSTNSGSIHMVAKFARITEDFDAFFGMLSSHDWVKQYYHTRYDLIFDLTLKVYKINGNLLDSGKTILSIGDYLIGHGIGIFYIHSMVDICLDRGLGDAAAVIDSLTRVERVASVKGLDVRATLEYTIYFAHCMKSFSVGDIGMAIVDAIDICKQYGRNPATVMSACKRFVEVANAGRSITDLAADVCRAMSYAEKHGVDFEQAAVFATRHVKGYMMREDVDISRAVETVIQESVDLLIACRGKQYYSAVISLAGKHAYGNIAATGENLLFAFEKASEAGMQTAQTVNLVNAISNVYRVGSTDFKRIFGWCIEECKTDITLRNGHVLSGTSLIENGVLVAAVVYSARNGNEDSFKEVTETVRKHLQKQCLTPDACRDFMQVASKIYWSEEPIKRDIRLMLHARISALFQGQNCMEAHLMVGNFVSKTPNPHNLIERYAAPVEINWRGDTPTRPFAPEALAAAYLLTRGNVDTLDRIAAILAGKKTNAGRPSAERDVIRSINLGLIHAATTNGSQREMMKNILTNFAKAATKEENGRYQTRIPKDERRRRCLQFFRMLSMVSLIADNELTRSVSGEMETAALRAQGDAWAEAIDAAENLCIFKACEKIGISDPSSLGSSIGLTYDETKGRFISFLQSPEFKILIKLGARYSSKYPELMPLLREFALKIAEEYLVAAGGRPTWERFREWRNSGIGGQQLAILGSDEARAAWAKSDERRLQGNNLKLPEEAKHSSVVGTLELAERYIQEQLSSIIKLDTHFVEYGKKSGVPRYRMLASEIAEGMMNVREIVGKINPTGTTSDFVEDYKKAIEICEKVASAIAEYKQETADENALGDLSYLVHNLADVMRRPKQSFVREDLIVRDTDIPYEVLSMGVVPVSTCQSYEGGSYNHGLLAFAVDADKRNVLITDNDGTVLVRSTLKLVNTDFGPALMFVNFYTKMPDLSNEFWQILRDYAIDKARRMGVIFLDQNANVAKRSISVYCSPSRSAYEYLDAFGGLIRASGGYSRKVDAAVIKPS